MLNPDEEKELETRFTYHAPHGDQPQKYEALRALARAFATGVVQLCPVSREQSLALTNIEQAVMWANAGVARRSEAPPDSTHTTDVLRLDRKKEPKPRRSE